MVVPEAGCQERQERDREQDADEGYRPAEAERGAVECRTLGGPGGCRHEQGRAQDGREKVAHADAPALPDPSRDGHRNGCDDAARPLWRATAGSASGRGATGSADRAGAGRPDRGD